MKTLRSIGIPHRALLAILGLGALSLVWSAHELPPQVASHFNAQGTPDGWMSRAGYLESMGAACFLLPLLLLGIGLLIRVLPAGSINIPRRDYWLAPEHHAETNRYLARHMAWLACLVLSLMLAINWLVVEANRETPPRLSNGVWLFLAAFLAGTTIWICMLAVHFSRPPAAAD